MELAIGITLVAIIAYYLINKNKNPNSMFGKSNSYEAKAFTLLTILNRNMNTEAKFSQVFFKAIDEYEKIYNWQPEIKNDYFNFLMDDEPQALRDKNIKTLTRKILEYELLAKNAHKPMAVFSTSGQLEMSDIRKGVDKAYSKIS